MAKKGNTSFMKRQKEQQRKEKQQEKFAKRMDRKQESSSDSQTQENDGEFVPPENALNSQTNVLD